MTKRKDILKIEMKIHREDLERYCSEAFTRDTISYNRPTYSNGKFSDNKWRLVKKYLKLKIETHIQEILTEEKWKIDFMLQNIGKSVATDDYVMMSNKDLQSEIKSHEKALKDNSVPLERNGRWYRY